MQEMQIKHRLKEKKHLLIELFVFSGQILLPNHLRLAFTQFLPRLLHKKEYSVYMPLAQQPFCSLIKHSRFKEASIYTI